MVFIYYLFLLLTVVHLIDYFESITTNMYVKCVLYIPHIYIHICKCNYLLTMSN